MLMLGNLTGEAVLQSKIIELQLEQLIISRRRRRFWIFWNLWNIRWLPMLGVIIGVYMAVNWSYERWALPEDRKMNKTIGCLSVILMMIFSAIATFIRTNYLPREFDTRRLWVQRCRNSLVSLLLAGALAWYMGV
jgi:hypothetical protein